MKKGIHSHYFEGITTTILEHDHEYAGESSKEPYYSGHIHYLSGYTTINKEHLHYYSITTGPPMAIESGHMHYYYGYTTVDNRHLHYFWGYTTEDDYYKEPKKHFSLEEAKKIGDQLNIDWKKFDAEQFRIGLDVELEHGRIDPHTNVTNDDPILTGKIALAHLNEFADYYTRLTKMEAEAEADH